MMNKKMIIIIFGILVLLVGSLFILKIEGVLNSKLLPNSLFGTISAQVEESNPEITITHTPSTKTTCDANGKCNLILYSGTMFTKDMNDNFKTLPEISNLSYVDDTFVFNWLNKSLTFEITFQVDGVKSKFKDLKSLFPSLKHQGDITKKEFNYKYAMNFTGIPGGLLNKIDYIGLELTDQQNISSITTESKTWFDPFFNRTYHSEWFVIDGIEWRFEDLVLQNISVQIEDLEIKFTDFTPKTNLYLDPTIQLQDADTENLDDSWVRQANPDWNLGISNHLDTQTFGSTNERTYIKFNISAIPSSQEINEARLYLYFVTQFNSNTRTINVHHIYNSTWNEGTLQQDDCIGCPVTENITWNNQICGTGFDDSVNCNLTEESGTSIDDTTGVWHNWSVTNSVSVEYTDTDKNVSFILKDSVEDDTSNWATKRFHSKEFITDTTLRPYLNITYTSTEVPVVNLTSPANNTFSSVLDQTFNVSYSAAAGDLVNATLNIWNSTPSLTYNETESVTGSSNSSSINFTFSVDDVYMWNYEVCDDSVLCASNTTNFTITIDTTAPTFDNLADQIADANSSFSFDINATDVTSSVSCFTVNDTTNFQIDCSGVLQNNTVLSVQIYSLNISVNDSANNTAYGAMDVNVTVFDTILKWDWAALMTDLVSPDQICFIYRDGESCFDSNTITGRWNLSGTNLFPSDLSNNVGIGTSTPTHKLNVVGIVNFTSNFTVDESTFFIDSTNNRVGIGTVNPNAHLDISGTGTQRIITNSTDGNEAQLDLVSDSKFMRLFFRESDGDFGIYNGSLTRFRIDGDGDFEFNGGNVGIGTTSPSSLLEVNGTGVLLNVTNTTGESIFYVDGASGRVGIGISNPSELFEIRVAETGSGLFLSELNGLGMLLAGDFAGSGLTGNEFSIHSIGYGSDGAKFTVEAGGNVGIGTTNPTHLLSVAGDVNITGNLIIGVDGNIEMLTPVSTIQKIIFSEVVLGDASFNITHDGTGTGDNNLLIFQTGSGGDTLALTKGGNVGINTTVPNNTLSVSGTFNVLGNASFQDDVIFVGSQTISTTTGALTIISPDGAVNVNTGSSTTDDFIINTNAFVVEGDTGEVGIGQLAPSNALDVEGDIRGNRFIMDRGGVQDSYIEANVGGSGKGMEFFTVGSSKMIILEGGQVGIGTATPQNTLNVVGDFNVSTVSGGELILERFGNSGIFLRQENNGDVNSGSLVIGAGTALIFNTSSSERMRIDSSGNVGINTTSPKGKLSIQNVGASDTVNLLTFSEDDSAEFFFESGFAEAGSTNNFLKLNTFWANNSMVWRGDGNIGIRTTNPTIDLAIGDSDTGFNQSADGVLDIYSDNVKVAGLGTDQKFYIFQVNDSAAENPLCRESSGEITRGSAGCSTSSIRYKQNIQDLNYGLKEIMQLKPFTYEYKTNPTRTRFGMIAEDVALIFPEIIGYEPDNPSLIQTYDKRDVQAILIKAIQELKSENDLMKQSLCRLGEIQWC